MTKITPILMSGGAGTRLWPLSRRARPKQFHALGGERTLIQETALRVDGPMFGPPMVVCNIAHADLVREQLAAVGVTPTALILEPEGRNTGPASAIAAVVAAQDDPDSLVLLLHADNLVADVPALHRAIEAGMEAAEAGSLVIFGITPTGPETGYGYIRAGEGEGAGIGRVENDRRDAVDPVGEEAGLLCLFRLAGQQARKARRAEGVSADHDPPAAGAAEGRENAGPVGVEGEDQDRPRVVCGGEGAGGRLCLADIVERDIFGLDAEPSGRAGKGRRDPARSASASSSCGSQSGCRADHRIQASGTRRKHQRRRSA